MSDGSPVPEGGFSSEPPKAKGAPLPADDAPAPVVKLVEKPRTPPVWRHYLLTALLAAVVAGFVAVVISVGVNILFRGSGGPGGRLIQDGKMSVGPGGEQQVFYPIPFAGPPHLELAGTGEWRQVKLKEQKADHFTVIYPERPGFQPWIDLRWKAEGIRGDK